MPRPASAYRDFNISGGRIFGHPQLCALPNGSLLVSTWMGFCLEVDPKTGDAKPQPEIGFSSLVQPCLQSPTASADSPILCCAATREVCTSFWCLGESQTTEIASEEPINSVLISPRGDWLALGLGMYPLASNHFPSAVVEIYETENPKEIVARRRLPGVAVDKLAYSPSRDQLVAPTGARSQDRGHVFLLDRQSCNLVDIAETADAFCKTAIIDEDLGALILAYDRCIQIRSMDDLQNVEWDWRVLERISCAAYDQNRNWIFLSNGVVLEPGIGEVQRIEPLEGCSSLLVLPSGILVGMNTMGVLRIWEV